MKWKHLICTAMMCAVCISQASALEYTVAAPEDYLFATPTSQDVIYEREEVNVDRSKDVALVAPGFGSPTSYLPGSGEYLTPNLVPGALSGGLVNAVGNSNYTDASAGVYPAVDTSVSTGTYPSVSPGGNMTWTITDNPGTGGIRYTEITQDLYYAGGHLGTLKVPAIGLTVKVYQGTDSAALAKGAGHFEDTSIWAGNICIAGHNRGTNCYFGDIHKLNMGDTITFTSKLGTRTYSVTSVTKISETDQSMLASTSEDCITLFTCVRDQSAYRWCVRAKAV